VPDTRWIDEPKRNEPLWAPLQSYAFGRSKERLLEVAGQFAVTVHPRYAKEHTDACTRTWCNIYVWDVTSAMHAEVPHWVGPSRDPAAPGPHNTELTANDMIDWLGVGRGEWTRMADADQAYSWADLGRPVVATYRARTGQHGHVAMVLPGRRIAQAGAVNIFNSPLALGFGSLPVVFFGHL